MLVERRCRAFVRHPVAGVVGREITAIEAIEADDVGKRVVVPGSSTRVAQCGYCQSGQVMAATALLKRTPAPTKEQIDAAMVNLCRCGTSDAIHTAMSRPGRREGDCLMNMPGLIPGLSLDEPVNLSRRRFLASTAVGGAGHRFRPAARLGPVCQAATGATTERGTQVPAFWRFARTALFACSAPFMEGGQGTPPRHGAGLWRRTRRQPGHVHR